MANQKPRVRVDAAGAVLTTGVLDYAMATLRNRILEQRPMKANTFRVRWPKAQQDVYLAQGHAIAAGTFPNGMACEICLSLNDSEIVIEHPEGSIHICNLQLPAHNKETQL